MNKGLNQADCRHRIKCTDLNWNKIIKVEKIGGDRSGTGDVFSSIVSASIVKGEDFVSSVEKATSFISKSLKFTTDLNLPGSYGVCFEEFLTELK